MADKIGKVTGTEHKCNKLVIVITGKGVPRWLWPDVPLRNYACNRSGINGVYWGKAGESGPGKEVEAEE